MQLIRSLLRPLAVLALLALACPPGDAFWHGVSNPVNPCATGQGGGANLRAANLGAPNPPICPTAYYTPGSTNGLARSTADAYLSNGLYFLQPVDLTAMGPQGQAIAAREGKRYLWIIGPDHPDGTTQWVGNAGQWACYSDDPGRLPSPLNCVQIVPYDVVGTDFTPSQQNLRQYQAGFVFYNPDAVGNQIWIYFEGSGSGIQHETVLYTTSTMLPGSLTFVGPATLNENPPGTDQFNAWSSFCRASRLGANSWAAMCYSSPLNFQQGMARYTSTTPGSFTTFGSPLGSPTANNFDSMPVINGSFVHMSMSCWPPVVYQGQTYLMVREITRAARFQATLNNEAGGAGTVLTVSSVANGTIEVGFKVATGPSPSSSGDVRITQQLSGTTGGAGRYQTNASPQNIASSTWQGTIIRADTYGQASTGGPSYASLWPIDPNTYAPLASPAAIRLTDAHENLYPGPTYLQNVGCYLEDGVLHVYTLRGFFEGGFNTLPSINTTPYTQGGALWEQFVDYYTFVADPTLAAAAAPSRLRASTAYGVVSLTWDDDLPTHTFRVKRGPTKNGPWTTVQEVTGGTATDHPTTFGKVWYQVVTLQGATERGARVVGTYSEQDGDANLNAHLNRVYDDGGEMWSCNIPFLIKSLNYLTTKDKRKYLLHWADLKFCFKYAAGTTNIAKVYDLGTTQLPRGGDWTICVSGANNCNSTAAATYSETGINNFAPAVVGGGATHGFFGGGRLNNIQRKVQVTVGGVYQKPSTGTTATLLSTNEFKGLVLQHPSGSSASITFQLSGVASNCPTNCPISSITPASQTAAQVVFGVFDGANVRVWANGIGGSIISGAGIANPALTGDGILKGATLSTSTTNVPFLATGSAGTKFNYAPAAQQYVFDSNEGGFSTGALWVFEAGFTDQDVADLDALYQDNIGKTVFTQSITCNGTNDEAFFTAFNTAAVAQQAGNPGRVRLDVGPSGGTCMFPAQTAIGWTVGINQLYVVGAGSGVTFSNNGSAAPGFFFGGGSLANNNTNQARTDTATAGSSCVHLKTAAEASRFTVGNPAIMTGFDIQGIEGKSYGYPPNFHYSEYKIVASRDTTTGIVCFTVPLSQTYRDDWPHADDGTAFAIYSGGWATLYALPGSWNAEYRYRNIGVALTNAAVSLKAEARDVTFDTVTFTGPNCWWPSQVYWARAINSTGTNCLVEVDKLITYLGWHGGTWKTLKTQSSSVGLMWTSGGINVTTGVQGTPQRFICSKSTLAALGPGALSYGRSDWTWNAGCALTSLSSGSYVAQGPFDTQVGANNFYTWQNGVISYPGKVSVTGFANNGSNQVRLTVSNATGLVNNQEISFAGVFGNVSNALYTITNVTGGVGGTVDVAAVPFTGTTWTGAGVLGNESPRWAVPGTNICISGRGACERIFQVLGVTQDQAGQRTFRITTSDTSVAWPTLPNTGKLNLIPHPASQFTCVGCTGDANGVAISALATPELPLWYINSRTYDGSIGTTAQSPFNVWGQGVSITYDVTVASVLATQNFRFSQQGNAAPIQSDGSISTAYAGVVDARTVHTVVFTFPSMVTGSIGSDCAGAGAGCLSFGQTGWFAFTGLWFSGPQFSNSDVANCPSPPDPTCPTVTLTVQGLQNVVKPRRAPAPANDNRVGDRRRRRNAA